MISNQKLGTELFRLTWTGRYTRTKSRHTWARRVARTTAALASCVRRHPRFFNNKAAKSYRSFGPIFVPVIFLLFSLQCLLIRMSGGLVPHCVIDFFPQSPIPHCGEGFHRVLRQTTKQIRLVVEIRLVGSCFWRRSWIVWGVLAHFVPNRVFYDEGTDCEILRHGAPSATGNDQGSDDLGV